MKNQALLFGVKSFLSEPYVQNTTLLAGSIVLPFPQMGKLWLGRVSETTENHPSNLFIHSLPSSSSSAGRAIFLETNNLFFSFWNRPWCCIVHWFPWLNHYIMSNFNEWPSVFVHVIFKWHSSRGGRPWLCSKSLYWKEWEMVNKRQPYSYFLQFSSLIPTTVPFHPNIIPSLSHCQRSILILVLVDWWDL